MTRPALGLLLALAAAPAAAGAAPLTFSFAGTLSRDDAIALHAFSLPGPAEVTFLTTSYAGGLGADGTPVPRGGFDAILAVFDAAGMLLGQNDDGGADVPVDSVTGAGFDSFLTLTLAAGDYTLAVGQFDNLARGPALADGFERDGQGNFTTGFGCADAQPAFNDVSGLPGCGRTGAYAADILAEVPEPASAALLALPALALGRLRRRGGAA